MSEGDHVWTFEGFPADDWVPAVFVAKLANGFYTLKDPMERWTATNVRREDIRTNEEHAAALLTA
jgi:hypothetical protein